MEQLSIKHNNTKMTKRIPNIIWVIFTLGGLIFWFFFLNRFTGMEEHSHAPYNTFHEDPISLAMDLSGEWSFQVGDDMSWKEFELEDSEWASIQVPGYWESQGYADYNGFAWYRKRVIVDSSLEKDKLIILLGKIDDLDQLYINGQLVGSVGLNNDSKKIMGNEWQELRGYYIPEGVIKFGEENVFAVRVYDGRVDGGIHEGPIGLITQDNYIQYWNHRRNKRQD